jgi:hypothetical protein
MAAAFFFLLHVRRAHVPSIDHHCLVEPDLCLI